MSLNDDLHNGFVQLMSDVFEHAVDRVRRCLVAYDAAPAERREQMIESAAISWAWLIGEHGFRLPASWIYGTAGLTTDEAVDDLYGRLAVINPRAMRRINRLAVLSHWIVEPRVIHGSVTDKRLRAIRKHLTRHGPTTTAALSRAMRCSSNQVHHAVRHDPQIVIADSYEWVIDTTILPGEPI